MKRIITYSILVLLIAFSQVQFNAVDRAAVLVVNAVENMLHVSEGVAVSTRRVVGGDLGIREAAVETGKEVERVFTAQPLFVDDSMDISQTRLSRSGVVVETNIARALEGKFPLEENAELTQAAQAKAQHMLDEQYFAHIAPTGEGPSDVASDAGYEYILVGENLAMGIFEDDEDLVGAWMDSPGHRANILHDRFTEIGVGIVRGEYEGKEVWLAVQEFGLPRSACPSISTSLEQSIAQSQNQLALWESELARLKQEIEDFEGSRQAYRKKVSEYNKLVDSFNALVEETKDSVSTYNRQVRTYNECIAG